MSSDSKTRQRYRFPTEHLSEADFLRLDGVREAIVANARHSVDPEGRGFDMMMMASDDGSFFPSDDWAEDWRDRFINVLSLVSRRISLAVLSAGFAIAGASLMNSDAASGYGRGALAVAGGFAIWAAAANIFDSRNFR